MVADKSPESYYGLSDNHQKHFCTGDEIAIVQENCFFLQTFVKAFHYNSAMD